MTGLTGPGLYFALSATRRLLTPVSGYFLLLKLFLNLRDVVLDDAHRDAEMVRDGVADSVAVMNSPIDDVWMYRDMESSLDFGRLTVLL